MLGHNRRGLIDNYNSLGASKEKVLIDYQTRSIGLGRVFLSLATTPTSETQRKKTEGKKKRKKKREKRKREHSFWLAGVRRHAKRYSWYSAKGFLRKGICDHGSQLVETGWSYSRRSTEGLDLLMLRYHTN